MGMMWKLNFVVSKLVHAPPDPYIVMLMWCVIIRMGTWSVTHRTPC